MDEKCNRERKDRGKTLTSENKGSTVIALDPSVKVTFKEQGSGLHGVRGGKGQGVRLVGSFADDGDQGMKGVPGRLG